MEALNYLRDRVIPDFDSAESDDPYALILVVNDSKDRVLVESEIYKASVKAVSQLLGDDSSEVREPVLAWLDGRIRKIVKRGRNKQWDDTATVSGFSEASFGTATVRAFAPVRLSEQPQALKKLQVTGLNAELDLTEEAVESALNVYVNRSLDMTVGKTVAQVNHAVQLFVMNGDQASVESWFENGQQVHFLYAPQVDDSFSADVIVRDAGFTEILPGSRTVAAVYRR